MIIRLVVIGRLKSSPEAELVADYLSRATKVGRMYGFSKFEVIELDERKVSDKIVGSRTLQDFLAGESFWVLDERGESWSSPKFSQELARSKDMGARRLNIVIGGADGLTEEFTQLATKKISFGKMVWPHILIRVMLTEQLYRAMTIMSGSPYHKE